MSASAPFLDDAAWAQYDRDGFLVLDGVASAAEVAALNDRLDDIMLGRVDYGERLLMQLDPSAAAAAAKSGASAASGGDASYDAAEISTKGQTAGFKGPSLAYRKIGDAQLGLECDPVFTAWMGKPLLRSICARVYGAHAGVSVYRAMVMSKPSGDLGGGSPLPWHQDGGDWWALDRDPLVFVWLALSESTTANGAVQVVRGSHKRGLLSRTGHTLSPADIERICDPADIVDVELKPGQAFMCHNWTVHRSGTNTTGTARRGFSVNYIDARTRVCEVAGPRGPCGKVGEAFPVIFPSPF